MMGTIDEDYKRVYGGAVDEVSFSGEELCMMVAISNHCDNPKNSISYRSLNHFARCFEQTIEPSKTLKRLLSKMLKAHLFIINKADEIEFDGKAFDAFVDEEKLGKVWWEYFGNRTSFIRTR